jgi:hypothetical protein
MRASVVVGGFVVVLFGGRLVVEDWVIPIPVVVTSSSSADSIKLWYTRQSGQLSNLQKCLMFTC